MLQLIFIFQILQFPDIAALTSPLVSCAVSLAVAMRLLCKSRDLYLKWLIPVCKDYEAAGRSQACASRSSVCDDYLLQKEVDLFCFFSPHNNSVITAAVTLQLVSSHAGVAYRLRNAAYDLNLFFSFSLFFLFFLIKKLNCIMPWKNLISAPLRWLMIMTSADKLALFWRCWLAVS